MSDYSETVEETSTHRAIIEQDEYADDPRRDGDPAVMAAGVLTLNGHRNAFSIPDPAGDDRVDAAWYRIVGNYSSSDAVRIVERYIGLLGGVSVYDSPHDGPAAVWYVLPERMTALGFTPEESTPERMREIADAERKEWRSWAEGDVWIVTVEERVTWARVDADATGVTASTRETWEPVDSVGGFIGREWAEEEARYLLASFTETADV